MLAVAKCAGCVLDDLAGALDLLPVRDEVKEEVVSKAIFHLSENFDFSTAPSTFITAVHRILKQVTGIALPFADLRRRCNEVGVEQARKVSAEAAGMDPDERFAFLVRWAIAGNHLDFRTVGTGYGFGPEEIAAMLRQPFDEGLQLNETGKLFGLLPEVKKVLYVHDNVGEIAFDRLLIDELKRHGCRVVSALRGGPITSDATLEDGEAVGIPGSADEVIVAGPDTLGISWEERSPALGKALAEADLVVAKGQANYYVLSEHRQEIPGRVACLLRTKCAPASNSFGFTGKINAAALI